MATKVTLCADFPIDSTDVFIYEADGLCRMAEHLRTGADTVSVQLKEGDHHVVAIANCRKEFNIKALERFDSIESLPFHYEDDNPERPVMTSIRTISAGDSLSLRLTPLLCKVTLSEVTNLMTGYVRLEDPRVYLSSIPSEVQILRTDGFHPNSATSDTTGLRGMMWYDLPWDVGLYPQHPDITLWCYPDNDRMMDSALVLECEISGKTCRFRCPLPAMGRGASRRCTIMVSGAAEHDYRFE